MQSAAGVTAKEISTSTLPLSAAAESATQVKLPPQFNIPGRYAAALYMASAKANNLDKVGTDVTQLHQLLKESAELRNFVSQPGMPAKDRAAGLKAVTDKMGATETTKRFVEVVVENRRTAELSKILERFGDIVAQQKGYVKATVTTATQLNKQELESVKNGLKKVLNPGETLMLEEKVDPSLISGIVIDVGDKHVDLSVQTRVKKLQAIIRNA